jgi:hypothetical protein
MSDTLPFSEAKAHLADLADRVERRAAPEPYGVEITADGRRHLARLPEKIADVAYAFVFEALVITPQRVSKPLVGEFKGLWSACRERLVSGHDGWHHDPAAAALPQPWQQAGLNQGRLPGARGADNRDQPIRLRRDYRMQAFQQFGDLRVPAEEHRRVPLGECLKAGER